MKKVFIIMFLIVALGCFVFECHAQEARKEKPQFHFDGRNWEVGYQERNSRQSIVEFVLEGETVYNWSELVTVQTFFGLQKIETPENFMESVRKRITGQCPQAVWNILSKDSNDVMYEWEITNCSGVDNQHEIARIVSGIEAIYFLHYATKKIPISTDLRQEWIEFLNSVTDLESFNISSQSDDPAQEYFKKGLSYSMGGKIYEAIAEYKKCIEIFPEHIGAYLNLGTSYKNLNEYEEAAAYYQKAADLDPDFAGSFVELGRTYFLAEQYNKAIAAFKKVTAIEPEHVLAYELLGACYLNLNDIKSASEQVKKLRQLNRDDLADRLQESIDKFL